MACTAREAMTVVNRELDDLHKSKRDDKDFIDLLHTEISIIREEKEDLEGESRYLNYRIESLNEITDHSIAQMYYAYVFMFIATGLAVWNF